MLRLKAERLRRGWPQRELAARAGIDQNIISRIEGGWIRPYPKWRLQIARALEWPEERADELFEEVSENAADKLG